MKKLSTAAVKHTNNFPAQKLTIGLDLGDRSSWHCMLDEAGAVVLGTAPEHDSQSNSLDSDRPSHGRRLHS